MSTRELEITVRKLKSILAIVFSVFVVMAAELASSQTQKSRASVPPGYTVTHTGGVHDFDYFQGGWTTRQRRLRSRGVGSNDWEEFPANLCMALYLDGMATVDELYFPTKGWSGLTVRTFDLTKRQWFIYWVSSASGKMEPPVVGGFEGNHGEFYGEDNDNGRPVKVRFIWNKLDQDHARWEQAFSYDNEKWETNWTADFTRADTSRVCEAGRPKRSAYKARCPENCGCSPRCIARPGRDKVPTIDDSIDSSAKHWQRTSLSRHESLSRRSRL